MNICELLENSNSQSSEDAVEEATTEQSAEEAVTEPTTLTTTTTETDASPSNSEQVTDENKSGDSQGHEADSNKEDQHQSTPTTATSNQVDSQESKDDGIDYDANSFERNNNSTESNDTNDDFDKDQQDNDNNGHNNIDFGHSILSNSVEDEYNFDRLGPFEKLCSLCDNPTPSNMESASKYLVPALEFCSTQDDFMRVFSYLRKYCFFSDVLLRSLWLEQIQNIIQYIHQEGDNIPIEFKDFNMANELAHLISDLMQEPTYQVKKYATNSTLCLIERQLLNNDQIERTIIPGLLNLVRENNEDFHIDCIQLFGKLAPLIGRELTSKYFLEPFCRLSTSPVFHTRKACASNITEIANIVSMEEVEQFLIPHFCEFMKDQVWAIRKLCADTFPMFAVKCRRRTRENQLTDCFIKLLDDNSRWVKISAYKSLGSFIATFSQENLSKEDENDDIENVSTIEETQTSSEMAQEQVDSETTKKGEQAVKGEPDSETDKEMTSDESGSKSEGEEQTSTKKANSTSPKKEGEYSNFIYWRNSIPTLEDTESLEKEASTKSATENTKKITATSNLATESKASPVEPIQINSKSLNYGKSQFGPMGMGYNSIYSSTNTLYSNLQQQPQNKPIDLQQLAEELKQQEVVPPILLSYFITMVEMNASNCLDAEMNYNCAFNFPAIAQTLGLSNWKHVRVLYKKLAEDNNWKVRQTLAYSIHELARILGTECTQVELVPVFDSFIKDVDEVRMGIVSNLYKFFKVLSMEYRKAYMSKLNDFLKMDNQRNWRFRNELGLQIAQFCCLFPGDYVAEFIQPVTFILALDKVAEVRTTAVKALTVILKEYELNKEEKYRRNFLDDVFRTFANNSKWSFRQLFVVLCENIFKEQAYGELEALVTDLLPKLLSLRNDVVANIRVCVARVIANHILNIEYFTSSKSSISHELDATIEMLSKDRENDVRTYFNCGDVNSQQGNSLPPYEEIVNYPNSQNMDQQQATINQQATEAMSVGVSAETATNSNNFDRLNDSLNLINSQAMNYQNSDDVELEEDDDDDDDDEIIDTTKGCQLKIVNEVDNDMEDDSDEVIDTTPHSPGPIPMKTDESADSPMKIDECIIPTDSRFSALKVDFPSPAVDAATSSSNSS